MFINKKIDFNSVKVKKCVLHFSNLWKYHISIMKVFAAFIEKNIHIVHKMAVIYSNLFNKLTQRIFKQSVIPRQDLIREK